MFPKLSKARIEEQVIRTFEVKYCTNHTSCNQSPQKKLLSVVRALDVEIEKIVRAAQNLDRETIFIFQSDNGGRSLSQA